MSDRDQALVALVWQRVNVVLADLADEATARSIVRATFEKTRCQLSRTDNDVDKEGILIGAADDDCITQLLEIGRADLSAGERESRAVDLILAYFDPFILRRVRPNVRRPCDVDHVANDVRGRVCRGLQTFHGERRQLQSYVRLACRSAIIDDYRRNSRDSEFGPLGPEQELPPCDDRTARDLGIVEVRMVLQQSLQLLSPEQRDAMGVFLRGLTWAQGEKRLGIPRQTLQSRFESAIKILRQAFSDDR